MCKQNKESYGYLGCLVWLIISPIVIYVLFLALSVVISMLPIMLLILIISVFVMGIVKICGG